MTIFALILATAGVALATRSANTNAFAACKMETLNPLNTIQPPGSWPYHCERPGPEIPAGITGTGGTLVAFGDSFSSGEGAPVLTYTHQRRFLDEFWVPAPSGFYPLSDQDGNHCHQSANAWGPLTAEATNLTLDFRACSGGTSQDYFYRPADWDERANRVDGEVILAQRESRTTLLTDEESEPSTVPVIPADTRLLTASMGGNNVHFADVIAACIGSQRSARFVEALFETNRYSQATGLTDYLRGLVEDADLEWLGPDSCIPAVAALRSNMDSLLGIGLNPPLALDENNQLVDSPNVLSIFQMFQGMKAAADQTEDGARVIILGYPRMFPDNPTEACGFGTGEAILGAAEQVAINDFVVALNDRIEAAATQADVDYVSVEDLFVPPGTTANSLQDHGLCQNQGPDNRAGNGERWINRFILSNPWTINSPRNLSGHPNPQGYAAESELVIACYEDQTECDNYPRSGTSVFANTDWPEELRYRTCPGSEPEDTLPADVRALQDHDIDGDGKAEAFVVASCGTSTSSNPEQVYVLDGASSPVLPTLMATIGAGEAADSPYLRNIEMAFDGSVVSLSSRVVRPSDSRANAGGSYQQDFYWNGASFDAGPMTLADVDPVVPPPVVEAPEAPTEEVPFPEEGGPFFTVADGAITCGLGDVITVYCELPSEGVFQDPCPAGQVGQVFVSGVDDFTDGQCGPAYFTTDVAEASVGSTEIVGIVPCEILADGVRCLNDMGGGFGLTLSNWDIYDDGQIISRD